MTRPEWYDTPAMQLAAEEVASVETWVRLPYSNRFIRCHCGAVEKTGCRCAENTPAPGEQVH